jgi:hypothetical protein
MIVCLCIASRDRPGELYHTVEQAMGMATADSTLAAIALDLDDASALILPDLPRTIISQGDRETSLGAKYNRSMACPSPADLFVLGVDDAYPSNPGWDQQLADAAAKFTDGVGVVFFGDRKGPFDLPDGIAVTRKWIEQVGFFCPPYFPFWWHDTWIDELAKLTGRYVWADVTWEKHGKSEVGGHKTTRMREVSWWARFFDATRQMRVDTAIRMINVSDDPPWLKTQLKQDMQGKCNILWYRNGLVRDRGHEFERNYGAETALDPGYDQIRAEAEKMLQELSAAR